MQPDVISIWTIKIWAAVKLIDLALLVLTALFAWVAAFAISRMPPGPIRKALETLIVKRTADAGKTKEPRAT